ncbi:MAG: hypothetical protein HYU86_07555 [Chloroflexi bacterium]|nr:hypothetical protein [Chloroflexota bacterium]
MKRGAQLLVVLAIAAAGLWGSVGGAQAWWGWCEDDPISQSTTGVEHQSAQAAAATADVIILVPSIAVSTDRGGANPHK